MNDKLKKIIFEKLNTDLSKVEIISYNQSIWFIDRENKYWYLELVKSGKLYWRYQFFTQFFDLFTMDREKFEPLIKEWVESILKLGVVSTKTYSDGFNPKVESVLSSGITSTNFQYVQNTKMVNSVLNDGVTRTLARYGLTDEEMESVLNNGVTSMSKHSHSLGLQVRIILNSSSITSSRPAKKSITIVESVLNNE
jgi:hypothetical protein